MNTKQKKKLIIIGIVVLIVLIPILAYIITKLNAPSTQQISQTPNACPVDAGKCSWNAVSGASSYDYKITDLSSNTQLKAGNTTSTFVTFQPAPGVSYKCEVTSKSSCGTGGTGTGTGTCGVPPTSTPTPTSINTPTPTAPPHTCNESCNVNGDCTSDLICYQGLCRLAAAPTSPSCEVPTPTPTPTDTPTPTPSPTPTPTPLPTSTPAPRPPVVNNPPPVIATATPTPVVVINNPVIPTNPPPQPTIVQTGSVGVTLGIVGGVIITVIGGALLLFL